jgi:hypothetical protein
VAQSSDDNVCEQLARLEPQKKNHCRVVVAVQPKVLKNSRWHFCRTWVVYVLAAAKTHAPTRKQSVCRGETNLSHSHTVTTVVLTVHISLFSSEEKHVQTNVYSVVGRVSSLASLVPFTSAGNKSLFSVFGRRVIFLPSLTDVVTWRFGGATSTSASVSFLCPQTQGRNWDRLMCTVRCISTLFVPTIWPTFA